MTEPSPETSLAPGSLVDHFKVMRRLGAGGMGEVLLARDSKLGRKVALKVISTSRLNASSVEEFLAEARLTARFSHPHIVTIYAVGEHEGCPYLALEYLEGQTLRQRMREQMPGLKESLRIGLAISDALAEAHRSHVLHRDLKPENVIIPKDGRLRVLDFGIAKALRAGEGGDTLDSMRALPVAAAVEKGVCGTPAYIAPELWQEQEATEAVDVWALGIVLYELFVGRHPFDANAAFSPALLASVLSPDPVLCEQAARSQSPELADLIERCLRKEPAERPSAAQVMDLLGGMLSVGKAGPERAVATQESPFRGLQPFSEEHAAFFFGREAEVAAFLERMRVDPVLPVLGPSGTGKSSFVQAGVIPMLREQGPWTVLQIRPGNRPFATLAARLVQGESSSQKPVPRTVAAAPRALHQEPSPLAVTDIEELARLLEDRPEVLFMRLQALATNGRRVLLFIDQLEELYTLVESERMRQQFMRAVCAAADDVADPVRVIFTLRDDFLGRVAEGPEARNALSRVTVIRTPGPDALKQVLLRAAESAGYRYDQPDLVPRMVAEVQGEPASLALIQFAARMLWERRDEQQRLLLTSAYEAIGGVAGALAEHADGVLEGLSAAQVRTARDLLLRLVTVEGTRRVVATRTALEGLGEGAEDVLSRLVQARLVTVRKSRAEDSPEAELELVHESLIHSWARFRRWVEESHEDRAALAEVGQAAELWVKRGRRDEEVWYGDALREAVKAVERCAAPVPAAVTDFLSAGKRREGRRVRRRRMLLGSGVGVLLIIAVVSAVVAWVVAEKSREVRIQRDRAEAQRQDARRRWAEAQREGARAALGRGELLETLAKLRGSLEMQDSPLGRALWWQMSRDPLLWQKRLGSVVYDAAFSPDGITVAAACQDGTVHLFDVQTSAVRVLRGHKDQVISVAFSPDRTRIASGSISGVVRLLDLRRGTVRHLTGAAGVIRRLAFSPRGNKLAAAVWDKTVRVWDLEGGEPTVLEGHTANVSSLAWSRDGKRLLSASLDRTVRLWDLERGKQLRALEGHQDGVFSLAWSPDGRTAASGSGDKTIRLWNVETGQTSAVLKGHSAGITALLFGSDGQSVISGSLDKSIRIWDLRAAGRSRALAQLSDGVNSLSLSPDGQRIASAGADRTLRLFSLGKGASGRVAVDFSAGVMGIAFSPDGRQLAAASLDKTVRLWDVKSGTIIRTLQGHPGRVFAVAFSPDGRTLASGSLDKTIRIWELSSEAEPRVLEGHTDLVRCLAFSPDGKLLASGSADRSVRLWDVGTGTLKRLLGEHTSGIYSVQFSPDGKLLATASGDKTIRLWEPLSGKTVRVLAGHTDGVNSAAFSPDGKQLASGSWDRTVRLWDLKTGQSRVVGQHGGRVYWLDFNPRKPLIGAPGSEGLARLWDLETLGQRSLEGHQAEVNFVRFSPDGSLVATSSDDGTVRLWSAASGWPIWRAPLLLPDSLEVYTHRGWIALASRAKGEAPAEERGPGRGVKWRQAVADRGVTASLAEGAALLCLRTFDGHLEAWDLRRDRKLFQESIPQLSRVLAHPDGCVTLAQGQVRLYARAGSFAELASEASAIAEADGEILVATGRQILSFTGSGDPRATLDAEVGVSAILRTPDWIVLGFKEGSIELLPRRKSEPKPGVSFEDVSSSPVVSLLPGPMGTLVAGYAKGLVGIWDLKTGTQLYATHLHGPVNQMQIHGGKLFVASELGDFQVLDLSAFLIKHCDLLREVWKAVPVVWEEGLPVRRSPPVDHPCH